MDKKEKTDLRKWTGAWPGAHHLEPAATPYSCHGVFTDRSIFTLNLSQLQIPTGTSVTNYMRNHKHGLMLTCRHVHVRQHCFILTEACSCRLELMFKNFNGQSPEYLKGLFEPWTY